MHYRLSPSRRSAGDCGAGFLEKGTASCNQYSMLMYVQSVSRHMARLKDLAGGLAGQIMESLTTLRSKLSPNVCAYLGD